MQEPNQFQHIQNVDQIPFFPLAVEELWISGVNKGPMETTISYDEQGHVLLSLGNLFTREFWREKCYQIRSRPIEIQIKCRANRDPYSGYITRLKYPQWPNRPIVEASLNCPPLSLVDSPSSNRFEALLLSAPQIQKLPIFLYDEHGTTFEIGPSKSKEGRVSLIKVYTKRSAINPLTALVPLRCFLTFVKGTNCGLGHLIAYDASDSVVLKLPGFTHTDPEYMAAHWFDNKIQEFLPDIFLLFLKACKDEKTNKALRQTINFYRASNASLPVSLDVAIITSYTALEAIVNHILSYPDNRSKTEKTEKTENEQTGFKVKIKDAKEYFGMEADSLSQSLEFLGYPSENDKNDVFAIISKIRNKLVHQDIEFVCSGKQIYQAWQVSQWLVEVLIFGVIGYRGHMIDRRIFGAHSSKVPLSLNL